RDGARRARPAAVDDQVRDDAGAGQGCEADVRLRPGLWRDDRLLDDRQVRRGRLQEAQRAGRGAEEMSSLHRSLAVLIAVASASFAGAQPRGPAPPPGTPKQAAPIDLTGQWVSIVTEDWRFRMVTPEKGDYPGVQLTPAGKAIADNWDPAKDESAGNQCKSYGAAAIMRVPGRLRVSWQDEQTLKIETDAGQQTRVLHFR